MLHALLHRKHGRALARTTGDDPVAAFDREFCQDEDLLTAMVFGRLAYLPAPTAWRVLVEPASLARGVRPTGPAAADEIMLQFWPHFDTADIDRPQQDCEPDVLWRWSTGTLVVEVKWNQKQDPGQLAREARAVLAALDPRSTAPPASSSLTVLALGGLESATRQALRGASDPDPCHLLLQTWEGFARAVEQELRREGLPPEQRQLLRDLRAVLRLRHIHPAEPFGTLRSPGLTRGCRLNHWSPAVPGASASFAGLIGHLGHDVAALRNSWRSS